MNHAHRLYLEPARTNRHPHGKPRCHNIRYNGEIILREVKQPFLDGCRELQRRGITGVAELWDHTRPYYRLRGDIAKCADLMVTETRSTVFVKYKEPDFTRLHAYAGSRRRGVGAETTVEPAP